MIDKVGQIMNEAAQDKIMVATRNMATSIGEAIKGVSAEDERVAIIRKLINDIRFESDKSGYFFVYKGTVNVILPPNAQIEGKDLVDSKDVGGIFFVREMQRKAKAGGGFVPYVFAKPGKGDQPKLSYAMMIPGTDLDRNGRVHRQYRRGPGQSRGRARKRSRKIADHRPLLHRRGLRSWFCP